MGLILLFDWLKESQRLASSSIKIMLSDVAGMVTAMDRNFPLVYQLV